MAHEGTAPTNREIELHSPWMRRLARALVGEADGADDVVQDVWVRLAGSPPERGTHVGYLIALVRSFAHRRRRGDGRRTVREASVARVEALPSTAEVAARVEVARRLAEAIEQLDEPYRTTLVLRYYDELSAAEIARRAGLPAGTVRARSKRGLDLLRARLDDGDGGRASWMSALAPLLPAQPRSSAVGAGTTTTATTTLAASALLTMKLTLGATLCALAALLAWTFVGRESAGERPLDRRAVDGAALVVSELNEVVDGAERRATALEGTQPDVALADTRPDGAPSGDSRVTVIARAIARDGRPLQGAWLRAELAEQHDARAELDGRLELTLERALLERLVSVTEQGSVAFHVGALGFRSRCVMMELVPGRERLVLGDVILEVGAAVHGRVLDKADLGVEGALVVFGAPYHGDRDAAQHARRGPIHFAPGGSSSAESAAHTTHSGPGGAFRLDGVPVGYGVAWARTATSLWAFSAPIGVRAGEDAGGVDLVVDDAHDEVIAGRVVDPDGRAVPGVELWFQRSESDGWNTERTDGEGRIHFAATFGSAQDILVRSPSTEWDDVKRTGVAPGTHDLELRFERVRRLKVVAQVDQGAPITNGKVIGVPGEGPTTHALPRCEAPLDDEGRAQLRNPGRTLRVRVEAPGYRDALVGPFEPSAFPDPLLVTLTPVRALVGRVLLPDGRPAARARVSLHQSASGPSPSGSAPPGHLTHQGWSGDRDAFVYALRGTATVEVRADDEGRFRLSLPGVDARAPGESDVRVDAVMGGLDGRGSASRRLATIDPRQPWFVHAALDGYATITSGPHVFHPTHDAALDLQLPVGGAIAGMLVLDGVGSTLGFTARASDGLAEVAHAEVAEDGTFRFERLHAGPWQVRVFEPGRRFYAGGNMRTERVPEPDVHVVAAETVQYEHRVRALESARLRGQLTIDGAPPGALVVTVSMSTPEAAISTRRAALDPDGRFEVTLPPGQKTALWITGSCRGTMLSLNAKVEIGPGDNHWAFDFETARLEVRVDPTGLPTAPRQSAAYVVERGTVRVRFDFEPSEPGHYGPFVVPAGRGRLDAPTSSYGAPVPVWAELDLAPGELRVLDLR
jgi:RNA polymerase sigma-70 factor (ECF subfamily)